MSSCTVHQKKKCRALSLEKRKKILTIFSSSLGGSNVQECRRNDGFLKQEYSWEWMCCIFYCSGISVLDRSSLKCDAVLNLELIWLIKSDKFKWFSRHTGLWVKRIIIRVIGSKSVFFFCMFAERCGTRSRETRSLPWPTSTSSNLLTSRRWEHVRAGTCDFIGEI